MEIFREETSIWVPYPGRITIWRCWFLWREENRRTRRKTLRARREPLAMWHQTENRNWATLMGVECFDHCTINAPQSFAVIALVIW